MADTSHLELREQFSTPEQQRESAISGMWIFIVTELMLFGGLFVAFTVYRLRYPAAFTRGSSEMEYWMGALNTGILISSSLTMSLAEFFVARGKSMRGAVLLLVTMLLGAAFLGIKFTEYYLHFHDHKMPAFGFEETGPFAPQVQLFFVFYYVMTGLHSLHLLIGIGLVFFMFVPAALRSLNAEYHTPLDNVSLYWHFIDVIWVFLFAIFYIPGAHIR